MTTPPVKWCDVEVDDDDGVPRNPQSTAGSMIDAGGCGCVFVVVVSIAAGVEMNVGRSVGLGWLTTTSVLFSSKNSLQSVWKKRLFQCRKQIGYIGW